MSMRETQIEVFPRDPLRYDVPLPYRRTLFPLGCAVHIATDSEHVIRAAEEAWGEFAGEGVGRAVELRLAVAEGNPAVRARPAMPRGQGHLISFIHGPEDFVICDLRAGFAFGWLTPASVEDHAWLRYHFLESAVYVLLASIHHTPIHAACIALNGTGVLLSAESGTGKSTLAYQCARRGWTYVCDDASNICDDGSISGLAHQIRFRPDAPTLFPELSGFEPADRPNGKPTLELATAPLGISIATRAMVSRLVLLDRLSSGPQYLAPANRCEAVQQLEAAICYGDDEMRARHKQRLHALMSRLEVHRLYYHDLDWAERTLRELARKGKL